MWKTKIRSNRLKKASILKTFHIKSIILTISDSFSIGSSTISIDASILSPYNSVKFSVLVYT